MPLIHHRSHLLSLLTEVEPLGLCWTTPPTLCLTCTVDRTMTTTSQGSAQRAFERGIVSGRVYRVCGAVQLPPRNVHAPPRRLIKLCDPFGEDSWEGNWRCKDRRWTPELKRIAGWDRLSKGHFYMSLEDFGYAIV